MKNKATIPEPNMPWLDNREDRNFRRLVTVMLVLFIASGFILDAIQLPEIVQKNLVDVSPRLAKLILEKQKVVPPPKPKAPVPEKEAVEKKKEPPKKEPPKPEKKKEVKKENAREVAKKSGLIAELDELADMREMFSLDDLPDQPQQTGGKEATSIASAGDLLSAGAQQSSGGIKTDTLNRNLKGSELAQRQTTAVQSNLKGSDSQLAKANTQKNKSGAASGGKRSTDEVERVFQKNKGPIFSIYNRALRKNPSLAGQVVFELTIAPDGTVTAVKILSSELGDEDLERKLQLRLKRFKFSNANVTETTVTYPVEFVPA